VIDYSSGLVLSDAALPQAAGPWAVPTRSSRLPLDVFGEHFAIICTTICCQSSVDLSGTIGSERGVRFGKANLGQSNRPARREKMLPFRRSVMAGPRARPSDVTEGVHFFQNVLDMHRRFLIFPSTGYKNRHTEQFFRPTVDVL